MDSHHNRRGFEKYRLITMLTGTSIIGILLIFVAAYNASRDLELIQEVASLHGLIHTSLRGQESIKGLQYLSAGNYQAYLWERGKIINIFSSSLHDQVPLDFTRLDESRINEKGGYVDIKDKIYTWAMFPVNGSDKNIVLVHEFVESSPAILTRVYSRRLLIPGIFYIWLMVWLALIIRFLMNKLHEQNKQLEHMALHDSLTDLPNRNLLNDRLDVLIEDCRRHQRKFALILLDLNRFKEVNDTYGHDHGDHLLCLFADRMRPMIRAADTFARIGGDEFILLLHDVNKDDCLSMCGRVKESIIRPYRLRDAEVQIDISMGVAIFPDHGKDAQILMRHADEAMYESKSQSGGITIYGLSLLKVAG